jgi:hypothetical protein
VNGLEQKFGDRIAFVRVNALSDEGETAFRAAGFFGHPSFLILRPDGSEVWRGVGLQSEEDLTAAIESSLATVLNN